MLAPSLLIALVACQHDSGLSVVDDPPQVAFTAPLAGQQTPWGQPLLLVATVQDETGLERLELQWQVDGEALRGAQTLLDGGVSLEVSNLAPGAHSVTLTATDGRAQDAAATVDFVVVENTAPAAIFAAPEDGAALEVGEDLAVSARITDDTEADLSALGLIWRLDGVRLREGPDHPGADGAAEFVLERPAEGLHQVTVEVVDSLGAAATSGVTFDALVSDADGDGYTNAALGGTDCDDDDPAINPRADEVCDGADNDCDGRTDDADDDVIDPIALYADSDGDGYGDPEAPVLSCGFDGAVLDTSDCDDRDPEVNPGAAEICDDRLDNDCDGQATECRLEGAYELDGADLVLVGEAARDYVGAVSLVGDVDGDGLADLLIGADKSDSNGTNAGSAYLVLGGSSGELQLGDAAAVLVGDRDSRGGFGLGAAVAGGDLNGDGYSDLVIGAPDEPGIDGDVTREDVGAVYVFYGPVAGARDLDSADRTLRGEASWRQVGAGSALATGDFDGSGVGLLVGAPGHAAADGNAGGAYLILDPTAASEDLGEADLVLTAVDDDDGTDDRAGQAVAAGDLDGDGYDDLIIAAPYAESGDGSDKIAKAGAVYVVYGGEQLRELVSTGSASLASAHTILHGADSTGFAGTSLDASGDPDGDGRDELLIGAPEVDVDAGNEGGRVWWVRDLGTGEYSLDSGEDIVHAWFDGDSKNAWAGAAVAWVPDADGDGEQDVMIGAPGEDRAVLFYGGLLAGGYALDSGALQLLGSGHFSGGAASAGSSLAAGDIDGDGRADLLVGAEDADSHTGAIYGVFGAGM